MAHEAEIELVVLVCLKHRECILILTTLIIYFNLLIRPLSQRGPPLELLPIIRFFNQVLADHMIEMRPGNFTAAPVPVLELLRRINRVIEALGWVNDLLEVVQLFIAIFTVLINNILVFIVI